MAPIFGADSRLDSDTITAPAAATGFPVAALSDDRIFTVYKPAASASTIDIITDAGAGNTAKVDYFMLVGHDLLDPSDDGLGAVTATFAWSDDNISYTTLFTVTPADEKIIARYFTQVDRRYYRLRLTRGTAFIPQLGQLQWGEAVVGPTGIQVGFDPDAERIDGTLNRSQSGNLLGAVRIFSERRASVFLPLVTTAWLTGTATGDFGDFWDNHASLLKPFLFHWNPGNPGSFEKNAFFGAVDPSTNIRRSLRTQVQVGRRDLEFEVVGLKEEN